MEELDVNSYLLKENLFDLFKAQLKKDFEGAGMNGGFADELPPEFNTIKEILIDELAPLLKLNSSLIPGLLYRIDISEMQLQQQQKQSTARFEEVLSELIIKRILQKVILRKRFSK